MGVSHEGPSLPQEGKSAGGRNHAFSLKLCFQMSLKVSTVGFKDLQIKMIKMLAVLCLLAISICNAIVWVVNAGQARPK